jgi:hypothetical protein
MPSSVIADMNYSAASKQLRIVFVSGLVYVYKKVPLALYEQMKAAFSKGYFSTSTLRVSLNLNR